MKRIVLISCCKQKLEKGPAELFYQSTGFKKSLAYAKSINPDAIYILSAKHHLVSLDQQLEYYDECLNEKTENEKIQWANTVLSQLAKKADLNTDKFIILTGKNYYYHLLKALKNYELPLEGLGLGYRLQWLDEHTQTGDSPCVKIHKWANSLQRYTWPFVKEDIPENGIYLFFEKGEKFQGMDRITRVGTHTGQGNLFQRINEHLGKENKDRSIFRKNIGRAILSKTDDPFLDFWNKELVTAKARSEIRMNEVMRQKYKAVESSVTEYMRKNLSFVCFPVDLPEERIAYEKFLINAISSDKSCRASETWLGNFSPVEKIKRSGMWLVNGLSKDL